MNDDLEKFFAAHEGRLLDKWHHYFGIYDRHLARFRNRPVTVMEFGVSQGGSLQMWRNYFGPEVQLVGVDINPNCKRFEEAGVRIFIGDQADRSFLRRLAQEVPHVDVLIDDGGHTMAQQIATYEELYRHVAQDGVFLVEDLHTSYWKKWGGGYRKPGSFIEYSKGLIDQLNAWHSQDPSRFRVDDFTLGTASMHFYDSVLVIEKRLMAAPTRDRRGVAAFPDYEHQSPRWIDRLKRMWRRQFPP